MIVKVTKEDVANGFQMEAGKCPVARGIMASTKCDEVEVYYGTAHVRGKDDQCWVRYVIPRWVSELIHAYDSTGLMKPFEFEMRKRKEGRILR
jgi:hypothetical protein